MIKKFSLLLLLWVGFLFSPIYLFSSFIDIGIRSSPLPGPGDTDLESYLERTDLFFNQLLGNNNITRNEFLASHLNLSMMTTRDIYLANPNLLTEHLFNIYQSRYLQSVSGSFGANTRFIAQGSITPVRAGGVAVNFYVNSFVSFHVNLSNGQIDKRTFPNIVVSSPPSSAPGSTPVCFVYGGVAVACMPSGLVGRVVDGRGHGVLTTVLAAGLLQNMTNKQIADFFASHNFHSTISLDNHGNIIPNKYLRDFSNISAEELNNILDVIYDLEQTKSIKSPTSPPADTTIGGLVNIPSLTLDTAGIRQSQDFQRALAHHLIELQRVQNNNTQHLVNQMRRIIEDAHTAENRRLHQQLEQQRLLQERQDLSNQEIVRNLRQQNEELLRMRHAEDLNLNYARNHKNSIENFWSQDAQRQAEHHQSFMEFSKNFSEFDANRKISDARRDSLLKAISRGSAGADAGDTVDLGFLDDMPDGNEGLNRLNRIKNYNFAEGLLGDDLVSVADTAALLNIGRQIINFRPTGLGGSGSPVLILDLTGGNIAGIPFDLGFHELDFSLFDDYLRGVGYFFIFIAIMIGIQIMVIGTRNQGTYQSEFGGKML